MSARAAPLADAVVLPPVWRAVAAALRILARGTLLYMAAAIVLAETPPNPLKQMRLFAALFLAPELAAWSILRAFRAHVLIGQGLLVFEQRWRRIEIPLDAIAGVRPWILPVPSTGFTVTLRSGARFADGIAASDPVALIEAATGAGAADGLRDVLSQRTMFYARARLASWRSRLDQPFLKFVVFALVPAVPAFRLHQIIAYGGALGEYYTFGLKAYLIAFGIWWGSWIIGLVLSAAVLRAVIEIVTVLLAGVRFAYTGGVRRLLEVIALAIYYIGIPGWLFLRMLE
ncbi:MAG TPA: hypothetical protein VEC57_03010 [Candidatus Limnocylindrales bacterium]|nr:hypothetical protein [Candidatus Limnocylindrales bacterium]